MYFCACALMCVSVRKCASEGVRVYTDEPAHRRDLPTCERPRWRCLVLSGAAGASGVGRACEGEGRVSEGNDGVVVVCSSVIEC